MKRKVVIYIVIDLLIWTSFVFLIGMAVGTRKEVYNHIISDSDKNYENFKIKDVEIHLEDGKTIYLTEKNRRWKYNER